MNPTDQPLVALAERIATKAHEGQSRRGGDDYITHPARVVARLMAQGVTDEVTLAAAWLHDVLEDTDLNQWDLIDRGVPHHVLTYVELLTHYKEAESYEEFIVALKGYSVARTVKIADILDNLSDAPTEKQIIKYAKALLYLHNKTP